MRSSTMSPAQWASMTHEGRALCEASERERAMVEGLVPRRSEDMAGPSMCGTCGKTMRDPYDVVEKRIEWRMKRKQSRKATILVVYQCVACVEREVEEMRSARYGKGGGEQGSML